MNIAKAKRLWMITDTHLGVRNSSEEWIQIMRKYFFEWFIPLVKKEYKPGDVLIHLGDVYDSRQSINLKVLNLCVEIFGELSKIFKDGVYVIVGNHDIYAKESNEINSLASLKWIPNINIFEDPISIKFGERSAFLMPWRANEEVAVELLAETEKHDYLFCHSDIRGLSFNKFTKIEDGIGYNKLDNFDRVYSGHIHYSQNFGKVRMLGSPYQLTRSDMDNRKAILLLDLETQEEILFENNFSPRFIKIGFDQVLEKTPLELEDLFRNNFVDVLIDPKIAVKASLGVLTEMVSTQLKTTFTPIKDNIQNDQNIEEALFSLDGRSFSIIDFADEYINSLNEPDEVKDKMKKTIKILYKRTTDKETES
jgi:DNA repair exonuclease SbcCD nuclease subunit